MILFVVGARPNYMKVAPVLAAIDGRLEFKLFNSNQHADPSMSDAFETDLGMPSPDFRLATSSAESSLWEHDLRTLFAATCSQFDQLHVVVAGDVSTTRICAEVAALRGVPVHHLEAGLRSNDFSMPEEINRRIVDSIASHCFATEQSAADNLLKEGHHPDDISFVGNTMIDTLKRLLGEALQRQEWIKYNLMPLKYGVVTLHRPSNVDEQGRAQRLVDELGAVAERIGIDLIFPVHPRTQAAINGTMSPRLLMIQPQPYKAFLSLLAGARVALTDSGGVQEESTALGVPCLTLRENTERPVTVHCGTNTLVGDNMLLVENFLKAILGEKYKAGQDPVLFKWDGQAGRRVADKLAELVG